MKIFTRVLIFTVLLWIFLLGLGGFQQFSALIPSDIGLAQWAPGIAGLLMLWFFRGDDHGMVWLSERKHQSRLILAVLAPVLVAVLSNELLSLLPGISKGEGGVSLLAILWAPLGALGEEIGWRGYLQQRLKGHMPGIFVALLVGLLWAPMHVHFFRNGLQFFAYFTLLIVSYSIFLFAVSSDKFSILLAFLFHLTINYASMFLYAYINTLDFMIINALLWFVIALVVLIVRRDIFFKKTVSRS